MKLSLLITALLFAVASFSQDKIILNDGRVKTVKIVNINDSTGVIESILNDKTSHFLLTDVVEYQHNSVWHTKDLTTGKFETSTVPKYKLHSTLFRTAPDGSFGKYSLSLSYGKAIGDEERNEFYRTNFAYNKWVTIAPEIRLKSWFSLKAPIVFGFGGIEKEDKIGLAGESSQSNFFNTGSQQDHWGQVVKYRSYNDERPPAYLEKKKLWYRVIDGKDVHTKDLLFQIGIAPKFFPLGRRAVEFYMSPSVNFGLGNYNAVDYYGHFETRSFTNTQGLPVTGWELVSEDMIVNRGEFTYLRFELLSGFDFNVTRSLFFGVEMGFSTRELMVTNKVQDRIYISTNGGTPELTSSVDFVPNYWAGYNSVKGYLFSRFHLIYKF